jgi:hypothetical protein
MRKIAGWILVALFFSSSLQAQFSTVPSLNALQEKKWAISLQVENIDASPFFDAEFFLQKPLSMNSSLQLGFGLQTHDWHQDGVFYWSHEDVSINCRYIFHPSVEGEVLVYYGGGPGIAFSHDGNDSPQDLGWQFGGEAVLGVECFVTNSISVCGEYECNLSYHWDKSTIDYDSANSAGPLTINKYFSVSAANVRLGLSAYFSW